MMPKALTFGMATFSRVVVLAEIYAARQSTEAVEITAAMAGEWPQTGDGIMSTASYFRKCHEQELSSL